MIRELAILFGGIISLGFDRLDVVGGVAGTVAHLYYLL